MFQPDPGAGASNIPPAGNSGSYEPRREKGRMLLYGSLPFIDRLIKLLHVKDFADPNDWSDPIPTDRPGEWMVILTKQIMLG